MVRELHHPSLAEATVNDENAPPRDAAPMEPPPPLPPAARWPLLVSNQMAAAALERKQLATTGKASLVKTKPVASPRFGVSAPVEHSLGVGGNSNTVVVANISPSAGYAGETLSVENCSWNRENVLNLQLELEVYKAMLVEEITARGEVENLLKKRDMVVCKLIERWQQDRASLSSFEQQVKLLERTISDLEATVTALECKEAEQERVQREELDHELQKVRARSFTEDGTSPRQPSIAMNSAERYAKSPEKAKHVRDNCNSEQPTPGKGRRHARKWSFSETEALKKGAQNYGHGQWKQILISNPDCFNGRTAVDLKDKWRNVMNARKDN